MVALFMGKLMGPSQQTQDIKVLTFACICVEIDLSKPLSDSSKIHVGSSSWVQQIDYKALPFHCRLCHEYGHLEKRCPRIPSLEPHPN